MGRVRSCANHRPRPLPLASRRTVPTNSERPTASHLFRSLDSSPIRLTTPRLGHFWISETLTPASRPTPGCKRSPSTLASLSRTLRSTTCPTSTATASAASSSKACNLCPVIDRLSFGSRRRQQSSIARTSTMLVTRTVSGCAAPWTAPTSASVRSQTWTSARVGSSSQITMSARRSLESSRLIDCSWVQKIRLALVPRRICV